jgi:hypothetical protein
MRARSVSESVCVALGIALSIPIASAADILPPERERESRFVRCVVESLRVDGLPVVQHGWCYWDTRERQWVPMSADLARKRVFGIRPIEE